MVENRHILDNVVERLLTEGYSAIVDVTAGQRMIADILECLTVTSAMIEAEKHEGVTFKAAASVRSVEDFSMKIDGKTIFFDVKATDVERDFSMPNIISVERLKKLYKNDNVYFCIIHIKYKRNIVESVCDAKPVSVDIHMIEEIDWSNLSIQNLGFGQIQLKNAKNPIVKYQGTRKEWLKTFVKEVIKHHTKQLAKTKSAIKKWEEEFLTDEDRLYNEI